MAWERRDLAATFRWSRLLGGGRWGAKNRDHKTLSAAVPLRKAWQDEWTKPGAEGGMVASVLENWSAWRAQTRDLMKRSELKAEVVGEARKDMEELMSSFRTVKKRRACPAGSPPAEIWTVLLHASWNLSPGGQGIGYQRKQIEPLFLLCRVRSSGTAPLAWHHSSGAPLHESNKVGPEGKRVVHVLSSVGKQFFKVLLRTKRDMWSPPAPADWLQGASHDMEAGTTWYEIADGLSRPYQCNRVCQVGGDGSSCRETWDRTAFLGSRDTGWRPLRSRAWMGISRSKLVKVD